MPIDDFTKLLEKFEFSSLKRICKPLKIKPSSKKVDCVDQLVDYAFDKGVKEFVKLLDKEEITRALKDTKSKIPKNASKNDLIEIFFNGVEEDGLEDFLRKMSEKTLKGFIEILEFETDAKTKATMADDIADEILLIGARFILQKLDSDELKSICKDLKLKSSGKKEDLLDRILDIAFPGILHDEEEEKKEEKKQKPKKKKTTEKLSADEIRANRPKMKKGITYDEIFQNYWADEIKKFCKEFGLKSTGKKPELIRRILAYFEGDKTGGVKEKKKRRKKSNKVPIGIKKKKPVSTKKRKKEENSEEPPTKKQKNENSEE